MGTYSTERYKADRDAYWEAQRRFRATAEAEIRRLMPEGVSAVILSINDTPRLTVDSYVDGEGNEVDPYEWDGAEDTADFDVLDQIAGDMEDFTWEEDDTFLMSEGDGEHFRIERAS